MSNTTENLTTGFIDWSALHHRLGMAAALLEQKITPSFEEKNRILRERAKKLAEEKIDDREFERFEVIEFLLAYERYAIASSHIREICLLKAITPLPGTPSFILGIINVRGRIVSVVDMKKFFGLPSLGLPDLNKVIIVRNDVMEMGLLADSVTGVRRILREEIQPPPPTLTGIRADYLMGVTADRLAILDAAKVLADPTLRICQETET